VATLPDLLERSILIELKRIARTERKELAEIMKAFEIDRPAILGGIFDTLSKAMEIHPTVKLGTLPRMADFARWGYAIGEALGGKGQEFLNQYDANYVKQNIEAINNNPVSMLLVELMKNQTAWEGTVGTLYSLLTDIAEDYKINPRSKDFPADPARLGKLFKEVKGSLEGVGIALETQQKSDGTHVSLERRDLPPLPPYYHNPSDDGNGSNGSKNPISKTGSEPDTDLEEDS